MFRVSTILCAEGVSILPSRNKRFRSRWLNEGLLTAARRPKADGPLSTRIDLSEADR